MQCPVCRLISPPNSSVCDCGYDFANGKGGRRRPVFILRSVLPSLTVTWLICTAGDLSTLFMPEAAGPWRVWANAVFNLFTPILMGFLLPRTSLIPAILLIFSVLLLGEALGKNIKSPALRIAYNLMVLLCLTAAVDKILWGEPKSIERMAEILSGSSR